MNVVCGMGLFLKNGKETMEAKVFLRTCRSEILSLRVYEENCELGYGKESPNEKITTKK